MRASRLVSVLLLLQTRGRMTAQQLAGELEVSVRTVYRDLDALAAAGVPLYADRGPSGGYQLLDGYRTQLTGLTSDEAESLFLAGMPGPAAELGLGAELAAAQLKLLAALPAELRDRAGRIRERFHLDAPGWFRQAEQAPHLAALASAVWQQRRVRMRYRRWSPQGLMPVGRTCEPLGLVLKAGAWYLVARALPGDPASAAGADARNHPGGVTTGGRNPGGHARVQRERDAQVDVPRPRVEEEAEGDSDRIRTYRVVRIETLEVLEDGFDRPAGFDLAAFWESWSSAFEARMIRGEAVIRLSPRGRERLPHWVSPAVSRAAAETAGLPDDHGWVTARIPIESLGHAHGSLLQLGADLEVLAPPELRAALTQTAAALRELYVGDRDPAAGADRHPAAEPLGEPAEPVGREPVTVRNGRAG